MKFIKITFQENEKEEKRTSFHSLKDLKRLVYYQYSSHIVFDFEYDSFSGICELFDEREFSSFFFDESRLFRIPLKRDE